MVLTWTGKNFLELCHELFSHWCLSLWGWQTSLADNTAFMWLWVAAWYSLVQEWAVACPGGGLRVLEHPPELWHNTWQQPAQ
jgi:hypothetical protein